MSDDKKLPARRGSQDLVDPKRAPSATQPDKALAAPLTGFAADLRRRALEKRAGEVQAQAGLVDANTRLLQSFEMLARQNSRLNDLDNIIQEDQLTREAERAGAQHRRDMAELARRRERAETDFQDAKHAATVQAELDRARRMATEAARDAQAAADISDEEVRRLYLEKATARIAEEIKHHVAEEALTKRTTRVEAPSPQPATSSLAEAIRKTEHLLNLARERGDHEEIKNHELFLAHLKALQREIDGTSG
jgi:hypothetical protein